MKSKALLGMSVREHSFEDAFGKFTFGWSCLLGSGTVWLVGLLGRAVGGHRVGIVAAALAEEAGARSTIATTRERSAKRRDVRCLRA